MKNSSACPCLVGMALFLAILSSAPSMVEAGVTGDLQIKVSSDSGTPLPGATVTVEGPAQPGRRAATTGERGEARFNMLAPGMYDVRIALPGYGTVVYGGVPVEIDAARTVTIMLSSELREEVRVTADLPIVNIRSSKLGVSLQEELVDAVPASNNFIALSSLAPGVDPGNNPMVHGARSTDNLYLVDGINTTDPNTGTWGTVIDYESVEQQDIVTAGHGAEYGSVVGMTSNLITKSGGNQLSGSIFTQYRDKSWYSSTDPDAIGSSSSDILEYTMTLGGPIVKDRLWWFASYRTYGLDTETLVPESMESRPDLEYDARNAFGKLTWNITPNQTLVGQFAYNDEVIYNYNARTITLNRDQFGQQDQPGKNSALRHTAVLGPNLVLQSQVSFHRQNLDIGPQYPETGANVSAIGSSLQFGQFNSA